MVDVNFGLSDNKYKDFTRNGHPGRTAAHAKAKNGLGFILTKVLPLHALLFFGTEAKSLFKIGLEGAIAGINEI